jgi:hypothetical protein
MIRNILAVAIAACTLAVGTQAQAATITIGDNDGFGFGAAAVPDGAPLLNLFLPDDRRSAAEAAASNGAQQTDFYSAVFTPLPMIFDVIFPLVTPITSGVLTIDMGGIEATSFGQIAVAFNGVAQPNLLDFEDGAFTTAVRSFGLSAAAIAQANIDSELRVTFNRGGSIDAIAFDYFQLDAQTVPEPTSMALFGLTALGFGAGFRRRRKEEAVAELA